MATKTAALVLKLVDKVTGPAARVQAALGRLKGGLGFSNRDVNMVDRFERKLGRVEGRFRRISRFAGTGGLGLGGGIVAGMGAKAVYDMEKTLNSIEARRFGTSETLNKGTGGKSFSRDAYRTEVKRQSAELNELVPLTLAQIQEAREQLIVAGLNFQQTTGALPGVIDFVIAAKMEAAEGADMITNVATAMQMPLETIEQAGTTLRTLADQISYTANNTNSTVEQMGHSFKFVAPAAAALGVQSHQLAAMFSVMAKRGIKASEAGVSLRSMFVRMIRPTKAGAAALAAAGINLNSFMKDAAQLKASSVIEQLKGITGTDISSKEGPLQALLDADISPGSKVQQFVAMVESITKDSSAQAKSIFSDFFNDIILSAGSELDIEGLVAAMKQKLKEGKISEANFFRIFDVRQGARLRTLFGYEDIAAMGKEILEDSGGFSEAIRKTMMKGIVGVVARAQAAFLNLADAIASSGVLQKIGEIIDAVSNWSRELSKSNPLFLAWGTYAAMAVASLAPLGFLIVGFLASVAALASPLTIVVASLSALAYLKWDGLMAFKDGFLSTFVDGLPAGTAEKWERISNAISSLIGGSPDVGAWKAWGESFGSLMGKEVGELVTNLERLITLLEKASWYIKNLGRAEDQGIGARAKALLGIDVGPGSQRAEKQSQLSELEARRAGVAGGSSPSQALSLSLIDGQIGALKAEIQALGPAGVSAGTQAGAGIQQGIATQVPGVLNQIQQMMSGIDSIVARGVNIPVRTTGAVARPTGAARRAGGPVYKNRSHLVGEARPEIFVPNVNGRIIPRVPSGSGGGSAGGGGDVSTNHFHIQSSDPDGAAREIAAILDRRLQRSRQVSMDGRPVTG